MPVTLSPEEVRTLGALMEKEITTPDYYPLTLNALVNACNQKSSREPVVTYDEATVERAVDALRDKGFARMATGGDSRVRKYRQMLTTERTLSPRETAALTVLLLRGPQTGGEIKGRTGRMYEFSGLDEVDQTLAEMEERNLVRKLPRQPGSRESRYTHLMAGEPEIVEPAQGEEPRTPPVAATPVNERVDTLEQKVASLEGEIEELRSAFADFKKQFE